MVVGGNENGDGEAGGVFSWRSVMRRTRYASLLLVAASLAACGDTDDGANNTGSEVSTPATPTAPQPSISAGTVQQPAPVAMEQPGNPMSPETNTMPPAPALPAMMPAAPEQEPAAPVDPEPAPVASTPDPTPVAPPAESTQLPGNPPPSMGPLGGGPGPGSGGSPDDENPEPAMDPPAEPEEMPEEESPEPMPGGSTSAGCGTMTSLSSGPTTIDVDGTQRDYILKIPDNYDPAQPHKLVFGLHWRGGSMNDVATGGTVGLGNYYGLEGLANGSAIFVAPDGIDDGWANPGGRDIAFMRALVDLFESELCIDMDRIFSVGFSYGGMMSFAIACEMADTFRAIAPLSGALYSGCGNGTEPIAMWGAHGVSDTVVPLGDGQGGLGEVLSRNNCSQDTMPVSPSPCVSYQGCDEGYPVTWCEFDGGHSPAGWQSQPIWEFFSQF